LGKQMGLRSKKQYAFFNGAIPSQLLLFDVEPQNFVDRSPEADNARRVRAAQRAVSESQQAAIEMFANRIKKNLKHIARQAKREDKTSYRIYDADLPDYAFAIDVDGDKIYVREYEAPKNIDIKKVERRRQEVLAVLPELLSVDPGVIYFEVISE